MYGSRQGLNIAFVGLNLKAQTACAEYLKINYNFKRVTMDSALRRFLRTTYNAKAWQNMKYLDRLAYYDALYKVDNNMFIDYIKGCMETTEKDVVIHDIRYMNELRGLQELGFKIVRVTTNVKRLQPEQVIKTAASGTTAIAMKYDKNFASNADVPFTVHWTSKATTGPLMVELLEHLGYKT